MGGWYQPRLCSLIEVAEELDIEVPPPGEEHVNNLISTRLRLKQEIMIMKKTYVWAWYFEENEKTKEGVIEKYLKHVQGVLDLDS